MTQKAAERLLRVEQDWGIARKIDIRELVRDLSDHIEEMEGEDSPVFDSDSSDSGSDLRH